MRTSPAAILAIVAAGLLLAGCYMSEMLLLPEERAVHPLALGRQTATGGEKTDEVEVKLGADGWYALTDDPEGKVTYLLFTPLWTVGERALMAYASREEFGYIYGVAERRDGKVLLDLPTCEPGPGREVALANNGIPPQTETVGVTCTFERSQDLQGALIDYALRTDVMRDYMALTAGPE